MSWPQLWGHVRLRKDLMETTFSFCHASWYCVISQSFFLSVTTFNYSDKTLKLLTWCERTVLYPSTVFSKLDMSLWEVFPRDTSSTYMYSASVWVSSTDIPSSTHKPRPIELIVSSPTAGERRTSWRVGQVHFWVWTRKHEGVAAFQVNFQLPDTFVL